MSNSHLRSFVHMLSHHPRRQLRFTKLRFTGTPLLLGCLLISGACGTAFPPGALDWGHGAKPLAKGDARFHAGGGAGAVFAPALGGAGVGGGGGVSAELQATDLLLLRADAALGVEAGFPAAFGYVGAGYVGAQLNLFPNLAARARLGAGASVPLTVIPVPYLGGETGLVWSFLSSDEWEGWVYGYGMGRVGRVLVVRELDPNFPAPEETEWVNTRTLGAGASVGFAFTDPSGFSWYVTGRTDVPLLSFGGGWSEFDAAKSVVMPTIGAQAGVTYRF